MNIIVHHVEDSVLGDQRVFVMTNEIGVLEDGTPDIMVRIEPHDVFEWRAAEYQIDVTKKTGWDELLTIVLYERHMEASPEEQLADPEHLFIAETVEHARKALLKKIRTFRGRGKITGRPGVSEHRGIINEATALGSSAEEDPLEFIKRTAAMSREHLQVKQEFTRRRRAHLRARVRGLDARVLTPMDVAEASRRAALDITRESAEALSAQLLGAPTEDRNLPPSPGGMM